MESGEGQEIRLLRGDNDPAFAAASSVRFCRICHEEEEEEEEERSAARSGVSIYSHLLVRLPRRKVLILLPVPVCSLGMHTEIIVISVCDEKGSAVCEICLQRKLAGPQAELRRPISSPRFHGHIIGQTPGDYNDCWRGSLCIHLSHCVPGC